MLKKLAVPVIAGLLTSTAVIAANLANFTAWDPTNGLGTINALVASINGGVTGVVATLPAPVTTGGTTIETDFQFTIPGGVLATGQTVHIKAYGANSADANAKTVTFSFGGSTCAMVVTASGANWDADFYVTETGSKTQTSMCRAQQGTTNLASVQATNWTVDNTAAIAVLVRQTAATGGTMVLNESWGEILR